MLISTEPQYIFHFSALENVDETQFANFKDPIVYFNDSNTSQQVQVNVTPFLEDRVSEMADKTFAEKYQYFKTRVRSIRTLGSYMSIAESTVANTDYVIEKRYNVDMGEFSDFETTFWSPTSVGYPTYNTYFGTMFLDLDPEILNEFSTAFDATR